MADEEDVSPMEGLSNEEDALGGGEGEAAADESADERAEDTFHIDRMGLDPDDPKNVSDGLPACCGGE